MAKTKTYKVLFRKEGINLAKTIYAQSLTEVLEMFKKDEVVKVLCLDALDEEEEDVEDDIEDQ